MEGIVERLADSLGSNEQKRRALWAAVEMEKSLPRGSANAERFAGMLRRMFELWVHHMRYLATEERVEHGLRPTTMRSDTEVMSEYGLTSRKSVEAKQEQLAAARETRIRRAAEHLDAGWVDTDAVCFVASVEEWKAAKARTRTVAA